MGAVVEIWLEYLIPFLKWDSRIVQCGEVNFGDFNYSHDGKYCDERGVRYNSDSDASDVANRCPECPECSNERHAALYRDK